VSVADDIYQFVRRFPAWKQDLFLEASAKPKLLPEDLVRSMQLLLGERTDARSVHRDDMPDGGADSERVALLRISHVRNVNALAPDQTLSLAPTGINIVYGANGAGKTGYSRLLKHAGRSLVRDRVIGDVSNQGEPVHQSAVLTIAVGDDEQNVALDLGTTTVGAAGKICVHDEKCSAQYVTQDNEIDYVPIAVTGLQRLATALTSLSERLDAEILSSQPVPLDLAAYPTGTVVAAALAELGDDVTRPWLRAVAELTDHEAARMATLGREIAEIDASTAQALRDSVTRQATLGRALIADLATLANAISPTALGEARRELAALERARSASIAFAARFDDQPLDGVGSEAWRLLWDAARRFGHAHDHASLSDGSASHCPLCMQRLDAEAIERMSSFDAFVSGEIVATLDAAQRAVATRVAGLPELSALRARHDEVLTAMSVDGTGVAGLVGDWLDEAELIVDAIRTHGTVDRGPTSTIRPALDSWVAGRQAEAERHAALERPAEQARVRAEYDELRARVVLAGMVDDVVRHLDARDRVRALEAAKAQTGTQSLSTKIGGFSAAFVNADLASALREQMQALDFRGLEVLLRNRTVRGKPLVRLAFRVEPGRSVGDVLSIGEQRRLALAMCLAEMRVGMAGCPLVLDDPVCSIDQEGRRHIAKELVSLAHAGRQIVVFTHELSFVAELQTTAARRGVEVHAQHIVRMARHSGYVRPSLPWDGLSANHRVGPLKAKLAAAEKAYAAWDSEHYRDVASDFCNYLRQAYERCVEDRVLGGVVARRQDALQPGKLTSVALNEEILRLVQNGVGDSARLLHDRTIADNSVPLTPTELREELDNYEQLLSAVAAANKATGKPFETERGTRLKLLKAADSSTMAQGVDEAPERQGEQLALRLVDGGGGGGAPALPSAARDARR
jgi:ABC-type hemin transport system ATPase subunit